MVNESISSGVDMENSLHEQNQAIVTQIIADLTKRTAAKLTESQTKLDSMIAELTRDPETRNQDNRITVLRYDDFKKSARLNDLLVKRNVRKSCLAADRNKLAAKTRGNSMKLEDSLLRKILPELMTVSLDADSKTGSTLILYWQVIDRTSGAAVERSSVALKYIKKYEIFCHAVKALKTGATTTPSSTGSTFEAVDPLTWTMVIYFFKKLFINYYQ
jgi:hypothetical protein